MMERIFGGNPVAVIVRLILISIMVGVVLAALGIRPDEILIGLQRLFRNIWDMGFDAVHWAFRYFLIGAAVVVPVWVLIRLMSVMRRGGARPPGPHETGRSDRGR
jgi:Na+/H+-dicarboxylate symporter